jgi:hypothetical protein
MTAVLQKIEQRLFVIAAQIDGLKAAQGFVEQQIDHLARS